MSRRTWFGTIAALGVVDWYCAYIKNDGTLSQATRQTFRTDTKVGKVFWALSWSALTVWILPHIWNVPADLIKESS